MTPFHFDFKKFASARRSRERGRGEGYARGGPGTSEGGAGAAEPLLRPRGAALASPSRCGAAGTRRSRRATGAEGGRRSRVGTWLRDGAWAEPPRAARGRRLPWPTNADETRRLGQGSSALCRYIGGSGLGFRELRRVFVARSGLPAAGPGAEPCPSLPPPTHTHQRATRARPSGGGRVVAIRTSVRRARWLSRRSRRRSGRYGGRQVARRQRRHLSPRYLGGGGGGGESFDSPWQWL